ncbi:MAG: cytochrome c biogenesis protein CcsA [candidate division Zixibacteria bacterium]|nr:cytochrome c biogenesis protein CcsA [candidate division Zixibacteria bacterium]
MDWQSPGELCIWFALTFNIVAGVAFALRALGNHSFEPLARRAYHVFAVSVAGASVWLYVLFFTHNYAFKYVYEYSERSQSFLYILSAFWGGQEGTYLLWLLFNAVFGYLLIRNAAQHRYWAMTVYATVNLFFLILLVRLSPFAYLGQPAADGMGLNPLLRDPWMVIHPPIMFVGYSIAALPFVIALAALIKNDFSQWNKIAFPWVAVTAAGLAAGNILGGFWAYKTLGWGGYWGWDPVENSSLVPWMVSLALLHGMILERRSGALRRTNLALSAVLFLLVVYGTFLTRSGVLQDFSVHSFTDLGITGLLVGFMLFFLVMSAGLFVFRTAHIHSGDLNFNFFGREFLLFAGMVTLLIFGLEVAIWMSLPLLTKAFGASPRAADIATYNAFAQPLSVVIAVLLAISPFANFVPFKLENWGRKLAIVSALAVMCAGLLALFASDDKAVVAVTALLAVLGLGMALWRKDWLMPLAPGLAVGLVTVVICLISGVREPLHLMFFSVAAVALVSNARLMVDFIRTKWLAAGGHITHFGFAVMIIGVLASSAFSTNQKVVLPRGEAKSAMGFQITYNGLAQKIATPNNEVLLSLDHGGTKFEGRPQLYFSERMGGLMKKPFISRALLHDTYFSPEEVKEPSDEPLILKKGEPVVVGPVTLTFLGFEIGQHTDTISSMKVTAKLESKSYDKTVSLAPARIHKTGPDGQPMMVSEPDLLVAGEQAYQVEIQSILADQGAVTLTIPGLSDPMSIDQLILDVSNKPLINLVWAGAFLILIGTITAFLRRHNDLQTQ